MAASSQSAPGELHSPGPDPQGSDSTKRIDDLDLGGGLTGEAMAEGLKLRERFDDSNGIVRTVRLVGGAMITILLVAVVLNEIFGAVEIGSGPFSGIGDDLTSTGVAAISLLVVGLLIVSANRLMSIFGGNGGM